MAESAETVVVSKNEWDALVADVRFLREALEEWTPVIHTLVSSGPTAWAIRRAQAKGAPK
jgi:hypothetical protein